jgi:hypothetical protein
VEPLLAALFELGDDLDVPSDEERGFSIGDNQLRIHWLLRRLTRERFDLATRSAIFVVACGDYYPVNDKPREPEANSSPLKLTPSP